MCHGEDRRRLVRCSKRPIVRSNDRAGLPPAVLSPQKTTFRQPSIVDLAANFVNPDDAGLAKIIEKDGGSKFHGPISLGGVGIVSRTGGGAGTGGVAGLSAEPGGKDGLADGADGVWAAGGTGIDADGDVDDWPA